MKNRKDLTSNSNACPCGSGSDYETCCAPLHHSEPAASAEALMRSRYSAFALGLHDYIARSWHPSTRPVDLLTGRGGNADKTQWIGLKIKRHDAIDADNAVVEFVARYKRGGRAFALREISRFVRENGHWFYRDGIVE